MASSVPDTRRPSVRQHFDRALRMMKERRREARWLLVAVVFLGVSVLVLSLSGVGLARTIGFLTRSNDAFADRAASADDSAPSASPPSLAQPLASANGATNQVAASPPTMSGVAMTGNAASGSAGASDPVVATAAAGSQPSAASAAPAPTVIVLQVPAPVLTAVTSGASGGTAAGGSPGGDAGITAASGGSGGTAGIGGSSGSAPVMAPGTANLSVICGPATCNVGQVCCNFSCGICTAPGATCSTQSCN